MAIEQTPVQPDLRNPRIRSRELNSLLWLLRLGGLIAFALIIRAITSKTVNGVPFATAAPIAIGHSCTQGRYPRARKQSHYHWLVLRLCQQTLLNRRSRNKTKSARTSEAVPRLRRSASVGPPCGPIVGRSPGRRPLTQQRRGRRSPVSPPPPHGEVKFDGEQIAQQ
jgi:hypothetical protein